MKTRTKAFYLMLAAVMLVAVTIIGTVAYLTSEDEVVNTFTVGSVKITLDETALDEDGNPDPNADRVKANEYKLMPGLSYTKDPVVHVDEDSEPCYIRIIVTVDDIAKLKAAFPVADYGDFYLGDVFLLEKLVTGWDPAVWIPEDATADGVYEFRYGGPGTAEGVYTYTPANEDLPALFDTVVIPGTVDAEHLAELEGVKITIEAHAIQAAGFADADAAWAEF